MLCCCSILFSPLFIVHIMMPYLCPYSTSQPIIESTNQPIDRWTGHRFKQSFAYGDHDDDEIMREDNAGAQIGVCLWLQPLSPTHSLSLSLSLHSFIFIFLASDN